MSDETGPYGFLAFTYTGRKLPLQVLQSQAGYYIGTASEDGPCSRESEEYWRTATKAQRALDTDDWTQRPTP